MPTRLLALAAALSLVPMAAAQPDGLVAVSGFPAAGIPGQAAFDGFGVSVAGAGDVNGDGHADLIVGAHLNDAGGSAAGRAYVYFGGPGADATPDLTFTGEAASDLFGIQLAGAGDVNGDGYDDLLVGATGNDAGGSNAGRAYVFFGGPAADATPDLTLTGAAAGDAFGVSVAGAGDIDGDGYDDLLVGATGNDAGGSGAGRVYVYFGGASPDATPDRTLTGEAAGDAFGASVAGAGDVDGDGFDDLVVGATGNDAGGSGAGRAYVYFGGPSPPSGLRFTGEAANDQFGNSVAGAGDVNGDGYADVIVGAHRNAAGGSNAGRAYVFFGGPAADATPDLTLTGEAASNLFGNSVAGAGDVNGDGYDDVAVGALFNNAGGSGAGRAYVFFGGPTADATPDLFLTGAAAGDQFGQSVAGAGDVDGDGLPDLVVGATGTDTVNGSNSGAVRVFSNANTGAGIAEWRALGAAAGDYFGYAVAGAGDVNGDGYDDLLVGANFNDAGGTSAGQATIYYGGPSADALPDRTLTGAAPSDNFGSAVAGAGDVNGDGYDDLLVGATGNDAGGSGAGRVYVYFGGPAVTDTTVALRLTGEAASDQFGVSVAGAGDVNGDGYADLIVGAWGNDAFGSNAGRAYVYYGGPTADATPDLTLTGQAAGDEFGRSVSGAGDVNGDGYADVIVGAYTVDAGGLNSGQAYVFFGGPTADAMPDLTLTGEAAGNLFGHSVAGAGDVNGDGYADVIVGASNAGSLGKGVATVYFGGASPDDAADLTLTGTASSQSFGSSVAGAGDVDGDGYADVIVGDSRNDARGSRTGQATVFFGGPVPDATADLTFTGDSAEDRFGFSIASAGDTNGDGRADLLVGAAENDAGGAEAGAAYLYRATGPAAAPGLTRLADVPGDQGGVVQAEWTRSDQETQGHVSSYLVQRSRPAGTSGYAWEPVATLPGTMERRYSAVVATYSDQTGTNSGVTCVRVTAQGDDGQLWRSLVRCGASIDNLAPAAPPALAVASSPDGDALVRVTALAAPPPDLAGYRVTRSTDAVCDASDALVGTVPDDGTATVAVEDDATPFGTDVFYCAAAVDVHGNASPFVGAASANPAVLAAVRVVLQGAYQDGLAGGVLMRADLEDDLPLAQPYTAAPWGYAGTDAIDPTDTSPANGRPDLLDAYDVVDWVLVEIRSSPTATDGLRAAALLLTDGTLLDPSTGTASARVRPAASGAYHVAVYHRTHLPAMSRYLVALSGTPGTAYDLSASPSLVYGTDAVASLGGGVYGLFAGDGDGNGAVLAPDRQSVWLPQVGQTGYLAGDANLDGSVLANDLNALILPNIGRQSLVPGAGARPHTEAGADAER